MVYANKSLVLYRLIERELRTTDFQSGNAAFKLTIPELLSAKLTKSRLLDRAELRFHCATFMERVYNAKSGEQIYLYDLCES